MQLTKENELFLCSSVLACRVQRANRATRSKTLRQIRLNHWQLLLKPRGSPGGLKEIWPENLKLSLDWQLQMLVQWLEEVQKLQKPSEEEM